ncbi:MAG: Uncharacterised protein [Pseudidiomarina mangrovi]|nr:MAG: Uncharacterised protein [Pseudidiomarina mangrovi]
MPTQFFARRGVVNVDAAEWVSVGVESNFAQNLAKKRLKRGGIIKLPQRRMFFDLIIANTALGRDDLTVEDMVAGKALIGRRQIDIVRGAREKRLIFIALRFCD